MFRVITLFFVCILCCGTTTAQTKSKKKERQIQLSGEVYDSFTKAKVKARMTLMHEKDSTVVDTMTCWTWGTTSFYEFKVPARNDDFIIRATADGYEDTTMVYHLRHIARNSYFELPRILMKKRQRSDEDVYKEVGLDGVVVTGTKVKLAYRGDTLVYNASAFNMPEGSMLDGLIRQMPGAELRDNGDIYVNGRKIDFLTLNGKDFFKGQNRVMLDNLPYYTVKEVKVYDKSTKRSELIGHDVEKKDYVMDVALKRDYNRGYMANVEAGAGTNDRYMARLFGLYYDDHSRVSVFGNTNNVNENRRPGGDGDWEPSQMPQGLRTTRQTGLNLNTEDKDKRWEEQMDATFEWSNADDESRTTMERFSTEGNQMSGTTSESLQRDFRFMASNRFTIQKPVTMWTMLSIAYNNGHRTNLTQDSTYRTALVNRARNESLNRYRMLNIDGSVGMYHKFAWGDYVSLSLEGSYNRNKPSEGWRLNTVDYLNDQVTDLRHYYTDDHSENYRYSVEAGYNLQFPGNWFIGTSAMFSQANDWTVGDNYRLDMLEEVAADQQQLEWLPSTHELLMEAIDILNNGHENLLTRKYTGSVSVSRSTDKSYFYLRLPVSHVRERYDYTEVVFDTLAHRSYTDFTPGIGFDRWSVKCGLRNLSYNMGISRPSLASLMPFDDTTNPLFITYNNPDLKSTVTHNFSIGFQANNDSSRIFSSLWSNLTIVQRSVGALTIYEPETGAYFSTQGNVNGNWNWTLGTSFETPLDKQKLITLRQSADADYTHSVDFDVLYDADLDLEDIDSYRKSIVHNWRLHEQLALTYQKDKLTFGISGELNWRSATSDRQNFERISAFDYNYGGHLRYTIPWLRLYVGTDIKMFSRRGYSSDMMNTDDLVWNAEVSRSLLNEKLTLKLTAFDLLHQLSNKQYSINAQGRTETWNNCIPRYVILTAAYKLNIM